MSKITKSVARHGHIHFGGQVDRASVNLEHAYSGGDSGGLAQATDVDVPVVKGSALANAIDKVGTELAKAAAKQVGHPVTVVAPKAAEKSSKKSK